MPLRDDSRLYIFNQSEMAPLGLVILTLVCIIILMHCIESIQAPTTTGWKRLLQSSAKVRDIGPRSSSTSCSNS